MADNNIHAQNRIPVIIRCNEDKKVSSDDDKCALTNPNSGSFIKPTIKTIKAVDFKNPNDIKTTSKEPQIIQQAGCSTLGVAKSSGGLRGGGYRNKIKLSPGHSALDWNELNIAITKSSERNNELLYGLRNIFSTEEEVKILQRINANNIESLIKFHNYNVPCHLLKPPIKINENILRRHQASEAEFWTVIHGNVYCLSKYMDFHPGGKEVLIHYSEKFVDIGSWYNKFHRWVNYEKLLQNCYIGKYVKDK